MASRKADMPVQGEATTEGADPTGLPKRSAFFNFMNTLQTRLPHTTKLEVARRAPEMWRKLSSQEKQAYYNMAERARPLPLPPDADQAQSTGRATVHADTRRVAVTKAATASVAATEATAKNEEVEAEAGTVAAADLEAELEAATAAMAAAATAKAKAAATAAAAAATAAAVAETRMNTSVAMRAVASALGTPAILKNMSAKPQGRTE